MGICIASLRSLGTVLLNETLKVKSTVCVASHTQMFILSGCLDLIRRI